MSAEEEDADADDADDASARRRRRRVASSRAGEAETSATRRDGRARSNRRRRRARAGGADARAGEGDDMGFVARGRRRPSHPRAEQCGKLRLHCDETPRDGDGRGGVLLQRFRDYFKDVLAETLTPKP